MPWPRIRTPHVTQRGASAWTTHSIESKASRSPELVNTSKLSPWSLPQTLHSVIASLPSSEDRSPTGHCDPCAGHVAALVRGEQDVDRCDLGRLTRAPQGRVLAERPYSLLAHGGGDQWGPDRPRSDGVHPDSARPEELGEACAEVRER